MSEEIQPPEVGALIIYQSSQRAGLVVGVYTAPDGRTLVELDTVHAGRIVLPLTKLYRWRPAAGEKVRQLIAAERAALESRLEAVVLHLTPDDPGAPLCATCAETARENRRLTLALQRAANQAIQRSLTGSTVAFRHRMRDGLIQTRRVILIEFRDGGQAMAIWDGQPNYYVIRAANAEAAFDALVMQLTLRNIKLGQRIERRTENRDMLEAWAAVFDPGSIEPPERPGRRRVRIT